MKNKKYDLVFTAEACAYIPALIYKKFYHTPVFWSVFDPLSLVDRERPGLLLNRYRWFEYLLRIHNVFDARNIRKIDKVIVPTTRMKRRLDAFYQIDTKVLPTGGVRKSDYQKDLSLLIARRLKKKFGFEKRGELILLSLGHFLPHRRYEDVLEALNLLLKEGFSNFKYIISGSSRFAPAYFRQIKNLVGKYGLDSFVLLDDSLKTNQEVVGFYQFCDVFLFVSVEQTWGLAPLEALMAGKPIIISQGVGCVEALSSGENAIVVGEKSPREIAASIKLLQNSKLRHLLAKKGKLFVEENLTYEKIAANLEGYFGQFV